MFKSTDLNKLKFLIFETSFTKINSYPFSSLNNLEKITFSRNSFETIAKNAFSFHHALNKTLTLEFIQGSEARYDFCFNEKSLVNINRPTNLILFNAYRPESKRYLEERIYLPFLLDNSKNTIGICFHDASPPGYFKCSDPHNLQKW